MLGLTPVTKSTNQNCTVRLNQNNNEAKTCNFENENSLEQQRNITERLGLLDGSEKEAESIFKKETPDFSDAPENSPFYNYDTIAFGKNGEIQNICGTCKRQFKDVDSLIRHHWKKHPAAICRALEVEQGNDIEYLHFSEPTCYGALTVTDTGLESTSEVRIFKCTFCSEEFNTMSKLHVHIITCSPIDPVYGKQKPEKGTSKTPLKKKLHRKIQSMFDDTLSARTKLDFGSLGSIPRTASQNRVFTGCRKWKSVILPASPEKEPVETAPTLPEKPPQPVIHGYNPLKHVRRRELTEVVDLLTCEGCGLKCKTIILLERHVRHCTRKEKFRTMKPLTCPIIDDAADKIKNMCFYCEKNFTYTKSLINHFQDFCPVKKAKLDRGEITEEHKLKEAAILDRIQKGEEEKIAIREKEIETKGKRRITWQVGRKPKRKGFAWTMIKRKYMLEKDEDNPDSEETEGLLNENEKVDNDTEETVENKNNDKTDEVPNEETKKLTDIKEAGIYQIVDENTSFKAVEESVEKIEEKVEKPIPRRPGRPRKQKVEDTFVEKTINLPIENAQDTEKNVQAIEESPIKAEDMNMSLNCTARYNVNEIHPVNKKSNEAKPADGVETGFLQCVNPNNGQTSTPYVRKGRSKAAHPSTDGIIEGKRKRERVGKVEEFLKNAFNRKRKRKDDDELEQIPQLPTLPNSQPVIALATQGEAGELEFQSLVYMASNETKDQYPQIKPSEVGNGSMSYPHSNPSFFSAETLSKDTAAALEIPKKKGRGRPRKNPIPITTAQSNLPKRNPGRPSKSLKQGDNASLCNTSIASVNDPCVSNQAISDSSNVLEPKLVAKDSDDNDEQVVPECNSMNEDTVPSKLCDTVEQLNDFEKESTNQLNGQPDEVQEDSHVANESDADSVDGDIGAGKISEEVTFDKSNNMKFENIVNINPHFQVRTCIENNIICATDVRILPGPSITTANEIEADCYLASSISDKTDVPNNNLQEEDGDTLLRNEKVDDNNAISEVKPPQCIPREEDSDAIVTEKKEEVDDEPGTCTVEDFNEEEEDDEPGTCTVEEDNEEDDEPGICTVEEDNEEEEDARSDVTASTVRYDNSRDMSPEKEIEEIKDTLEPEVINNKLEQLIAENETTEKVGDMMTDATVTETAEHTENKSDENIVDGSEQNEVKTEERVEADEGSGYFSSENESVYTEDTTSQITEHNEQDSSENCASSAADKQGKRVGGLILSPGERVKMNRRSCKKDIDLTSTVWIKRTRYHPHLKGEQKDPDAFDEEPSSESVKTSSAKALQKTVDKSCDRTKRSKSENVETSENIQGISKGRKRKLSESKEVWKKAKVEKVESGSTALTRVRSKRS